MSDKFVLPIGINAETLINPLDKSIDTLEKIQQASRETGKSLNDAFNQGSTALDKIEDKLKPMTKDLEAVKVMGKQMGKELADAFSQRNIDPSKLEKSVESFKKKLASIQKVDISVDADPAKLAVYEKQLEQATNAVDMLKVAVAATKDMMQDLDPNSPEYQQAAQNIAFLEESMNTYADEVNKTTDAQRTLKSELKEIKNDLQQLELNGQKGSQRFKDLAARAGELEDQIGNTNAQIKVLASDTKTFDGLISGATGLVGAFTAVQGAAALWGGENEELEKTLIKVNGAMAILQGLQAVAEVLNKDSAFSILFLSKARKADVVETSAQTAATATQTTVTKGATVATKLFSVALKAMGIGLIIGLIAYLITNWDKLKKSLDNLLPAGMKTADMFDEIKAVAVGVGNVLLNFVIAPFKILESLLTDGLDSAIEQAKQSYNAFENYQKGKQGQEINNLLAHEREKKKIRLEAWDNELKVQEAAGKDTYASRKKWRENKARLMAQEGEDNKALLQEQREETARYNASQAKAAQEAAKQRAESAKAAAAQERQRREEAARKAAEFEKQQSELVEKYARETNALRIENLTDGLEKERQKIQDDAKNRIADLNKDEAKRADAVAKRAELIKAIEEDAKNKIVALEREKQIEILQTQLAGAEMLANLSKDSLDKSLELARINHEKTLLDIETNYKDQADLRIKLVNAENENYQREQDRINLENKQKINEVEQEKALLTIELMQKYAGDGVDIEEQKQLAILGIKAEYAQKGLDALLASGKDETDIEVMRARKLVQDTQKAVEDEVKKGKKFDMFKFLGLGSLSKEEQNAVVDSAKQMYSSLREIGDGLVEMYQQQIDKKQEVIDQYDDEIDELEGKLEDEKELRDEGLANDVERIEKEIADKKAARDEEIRQQQELQEKKVRMQKIAMAADTALQLVNMITAATNIFSTLSGIPFIGIPLAIATIAAMFGAFAIAKVNAFNAIKSGQQFGDGGEIDGNSHANGGVQYYSKDGKNISLEGGEFVTKKKSYQKHKRLAQAINADDFSGLTIDDIAALGVFEAMGISFTDVAQDANFESNEVRSGGGVSINVESGNQHFKRMDANLEYLARSKKGEVVVYDEGKYTVTKRGTKTTKKRKK